MSLAGVRALRPKTNCIESKSEFVDRLKLNPPIWREYVQRREKLKSQGVSPQDAYYMLRGDYALEIEVPAPGEVPELVEQERAAEEAALGRVSYEQLAQAARGRKCSRAVAMEWVEAHLALPLGDIDPAGVPSSAAVALLQWAKSSSGADDFFRGLYKSQLPTKKEVDQDSKFTDDGRELGLLLDKLERAARKERKL